MEENAQGASDLNRVQQEKNELDEAKRELYEIKSRLESLNLPDGFKVVSIGKYSKLKVSNRIEEKDVIELELENEEQERQVLLYKELDEKQLLLIATINEKEQIILEEEYKQLAGERYRGFISKEELDTPYDINKDEMQKESEINPDEPEQEIEENETGKSSDELEIAAKLGIPPSQILNVVEVKDEEAMSNTLNKNLENKTLYAVRLKTPAGKLTSNEWVMMQKDSSGNFERGMREDPSDTLNTIGHELGIRSTRQNDTIEDGEITAEAAPDNNSKRHIEIRRHRFTDGNTYVLEVDKTYESVLHVYKEENGKLEPICIDEHGEHEAEKIVLADRVEALEVQEEKKEEEDKTPGGDAYERMYNRGHN